jgi:poly [ADP-ribose] polymerase
MPTLIKETKLIFVENGLDPKTGKPLNNNKYWLGKQYDDGNWSAEWGRVGCAKPSSGTWSDSKKSMDSVVRSKIRDGYTEAKTIGEGVASGGGNASPVRNADLLATAKQDLLKVSNPTLEKLIRRFVDANVHKITTSTQITFNSTTGLFATPLGIVTPEGLTEARDLLADIAPLVRKGKFTTEADALLCKYLRIIPQSLGMKRFTVQTLIPDDNAIQKQNDLIDALESSYQAMSTAPAPKAGSAPKASVFKVDLDVLNDSSERDRLTRFFEKSKKSQHGYDNVRVREIYVVNIHDMTNAYERQTTPHQEVFHGTSQANCLSILKSGLKVSPPSTAAIAGKMFGNGIYGAINSTKSLGYTFGRWGQGGTGDAGWLFICDFAMGKIQTVNDSKYNGADRGYDSIWAKAGYALRNDELIVYRNSQVKIKYLLECK